MAVRPGRDIKAPFVTSGNPDSVNDAPVTTTTVGGAYDLSGQLGAVLRSNDGTKEWIYVKFSSTSTGKTPAANQLCFWVANSTSNLATPNAWVVDNQTSANTGTSVAYPAGVLRVAATRGNFVWLMRKSPSCLVVSTATGFIAGNAVIATTASGEASFISSTSTIAPAGGIGASPWFAGAPRIGWVNSTTTSSVAIDTQLDIE